MTTYEQRPPVNNRQTKSGQANFDTNFDCKISTDQPPIYNPYFFVVPRVAFVDRFESRCKKFSSLGAVTGDKNKESMKAK
jgi:hypothetical protein